MFLGLLKEQKTADMCAPGCVYTPAVKAAKVVTLHSAVIQRNGWKHMAGVCRSEGDATSAEAKPNGRYSKTAGADGGPATQEECMDHCAAEKHCIGYAHADSSWCLNYGPNLHDVGDGSIWVGDNHVATTITQTKANPAYICGVKCTHMSCPNAEDEADKEAEDEADKAEDEADKDLESSMCWRGAMVTLSLWLTNFLQ
jgi:hypothetical protein